LIDIIDLNPNNTRQMCRRVIMMMTTIIIMQWSTSKVS